VQFASTFSRIVILMSQNATAQQPKRHGFIEAHEILDAIIPMKCITCLGEKAASGVNTICSYCEDLLVTDPPLHRLHQHTLELYNFQIALLRKTVSDNSDGGRCLPSRDSYTMFYESGVPGVKTKVRQPPGDDLQWQDDGKTFDVHSQLLTPDVKELLPQVQLTDMQCHNALLMLSELVKTQFFYGMTDCVNLLCPIVDNEKKVARS
jgi:hypothetical protein